MQAIRSIKVGYADPVLNTFLAATRNRPLLEKGIDNADLSGYLHPEVTREALEANNLLFSFTVKMHPEFRPTPDTVAGEDQILFSSRASSISTNAGACWSYIISHRDISPAAAVHVSSLHTGDESVHRGMLLFAYANLWRMVPRMAPEMGFKAFISGGRINSLTRDPVKMGLFHMSAESCRNWQISRNRSTLQSVVHELLTRGVFIDEIDIGRSYRHQELSFITGKYTAQLM
ncbi:hypothetical protein ACFLZ2_04530 [Candidatus Margulisiibacteriota bacterium]